MDTRFPTSEINQLLPVMLVCCLTSISGFSLGPEAPMVTVGGLVGVALARTYLQSTKNMKFSSSTSPSSSSSAVMETLAYAGAAGSLTGFMNIPIDGPIFALEMMSRRAWISSFAAK